MKFLLLIQQLPIPVRVVLFVWNLLLGLVLAFQVIPTARSLDKMATHVEKSALVQKHVDAKIGKKLEEDEQRQIFVGTAKGEVDVE